MELGVLAYEMGEMPNGHYLQCCPINLVYKEHAIQEAFEFHLWWEKGQLASLFPAGIPSIVTKIVTAVEYGFRRGERDRYERKRKEKPSV